MAAYKTGAVGAFNGADAASCGSLREGISIIPAACSCPQFISLNMQQPDFEAVLTTILDSDPRYHREAYTFLKEALDFAQKAISKASKNQVGHITARELLDGIRQYGLSQYGPMAKTVLNEWGVFTCEDFGEMVFILVEHGLLRKKESDKKDDFKGGYDFAEAFERPFRPAQGRIPMPSSDDAKVARS